MHPNMNSFPGRKLDKDESAAGPLDNSHDWRVAIKVTSPTQTRFGRAEYPIEWVRRGPMRRFGAGSDHEAPPPFAEYIVQPSQFDNLIPATRNPFPLQMPPPILEYPAPSPYPPTPSLLVRFKMPPNFCILNFKHLERPVRRQSAQK